MIMNDVLEKMDNLLVVKRDSKKVPFNGSKIAMAVKKGFDSIITTNDECTYNEKDIQKIYQGVLKRIDKEYIKTNEPKIRIETIQDMIEEELKHQGYDDVYNSFSEYRKKRSASRKIFSNEKKLHKFIKAIESLGLKSATEEDVKRENANVDGDTAMGTMLQYGSTVSKEFAKSYLMRNKFAMAHDNGDIHIHDLDFMAMGTTTCTQIDLRKLFTDGFSTGHGHLREPNDIMSYGALAAIAIQSNQNDQHGGQSIPAFDYYLAPGVLKTYKKQLKQTIYDFLELEGFENLVKFDHIVKDIDKLKSIKVNIKDFENYYKDSSEVEGIFNKA